MIIKKEKIQTVLVNELNGKVFIMVDNLEQNELKILKQLRDFLELHYPYLININENDDLQN